MQLKILKARIIRADKLYNYNCITFGYKHDLFKLSGVGVLSGNCMLEKVYMHDLYIILTLQVSP